MALRELATALGWDYQRARATIREIERIAGRQILPRGRVGLHGHVVDLADLVDVAHVVESRIARMETAYRVVRPEIVATLDAEPTMRLPDLVARFPGVGRRTLGAALTDWRRARGKTVPYSDVRALFAAHVEPLLTRNPLATIHEIEASLPSAVPRSSLQARVTVWRREHGYLRPRRRGEHERSPTQHRRRGET